MKKNEVKALLRKSRLQFSKHGIRGGSIGPMTVTNAHLERNAAVEQEVVNLLSSAGFSQKGELITNEELSFKLIWNLWPTYKASEGYDPTYQTYWASILWK